MSRRVKLALSLGEVVVSFWLLHRVLCSFRQVMWALKGPADQKGLERVENTFIISLCWVSR